MADGQELVVDRGTSPTGCLRFRDLRILHESFTEAPRRQHRRWPGTRHECPRNDCFVQTARSGWMTAAARRALLVRDGLVAVAEWEADHGALTAEELAAARRRVSGRVRRTRHAKR